MIDLHEFLNRLRSQHSFEYTGKTLFRIGITDDDDGPPVTLYIEKISENTYGNTTLHYRYVPEDTSREPYQWTPYARGHKIDFMRGRSLNGLVMTCSMIED